MKKFLILLQKEIKELITPQLVIPLIFTAVLFGVLGNVISNEREKITAPQNIAIINEDNSEFSAPIIQALTANNFNIVNFEQQDIKNIFKENKDIDIAMYIPASFGQGISDLQPQKLEIYSNIKNFSLFGSFKSLSLKQIIGYINNSVSDQVIKNGLPNVDPENIKNLIQAEEFVVIQNRMAQADSDQVMNFIRSQTAFMPIILFMVIILAAQMVATTVATEKENKTLETLLSSPVSRKTIVLAKITAAGIMALIFAAVFMFGFNSYINGIMGNELQTSSAGLGTSLTELQIGMILGGYIVLGISLFLAILCALALAIILGILAEDVKGVQAVTTPLMILIMVPYFLTMFFDINTISPLAKIAIYIIPFSHPFLVPQNLIMHNYSLIIIGVLYELLIFALLITIAAKIFSSDKVITMKLSFKKKLLRK